jgi:conjugal transfer pilus assembly protein TraI
MEQDVVPTHPSQTFDYPAASVADLLTPHEALLDRIRIGYGVDASTFEREVMAAVRGYAAFVHLLPATADNHFSTPGGLLELGLEVGFFALQGTDAHIFSGRATISTRRLLEPPACAARRTGR